MFGTKGDEGDRNHFQLSEASQDGTYGEHGRLGAASPGTETRGSNMYGAGLQPDSARQGEEGSSALSYATLAEAPQASLIHLVNLYHQTLLDHGLVLPASITNVLSSLVQNEEQRVENEELKGMDLLLKEGLLKYLLSIQPYIPEVPRQVAKLPVAINFLIAITTNSLSGAIL